MEQKHLFWGILRPKNNYPTRRPTFPHSHLYLQLRIEGKIQPLWVLPTYKICYVEYGWFVEVNLWLLHFLSLSAVFPSFSPAPMWAGHTQRRLYLAAPAAVQSLPNY